MRGAQGEYENIQASQEAAQEAAQQRQQLALMNQYETDRFAAGEQSL